MFEFPEQLTYEHFEQMFDLEKSFYNEEFITPADEAWRWYEQHPHSVTVAMDGEKLAGFVNLFPVRQELYNAIVAGEFNDADLVADDIVSLEDLADPAQPCQMFLSCIVIDESHRSQGLTHALLKAAAEQYLPWAERLERVAVDTVTADGSRFAERLGFRFLRHSSHDSRIYEQDFGSFIQNIR